MAVQLIVGSIAPPPFQLIVSSSILNELSRVLHSRLVHLITYLEEYFNLNFEFQEEVDNLPVHNSFLIVRNDHWQT